MLNCSRVIGEKAKCLTSRSSNVVILKRSLSTTKSLMESSDVLVLSAVRTPIGSFRSTLSSLSAPQLGSVAIKVSKIFYEPLQIVFSI
jgi:hypothetical protein